MKNIKILQAISLAQMILVALFLWYVWQSDKAMDKAGIGNLQLSQQYNSNAGIAISIAVTLWVGSILVAILSKSFKEKSSQIAIALPPLLLVLGWLSLWI